MNQPVELTREEIELLLRLLYRFRFDPKRQAFEGTGLELKLEEAARKATTLTPAD